MPNWCYTNYSISNLKGAEAIAEKWRKWLEEGKNDSDFENRWLGSLVKGAGLGDPLKNEGPYCRGEIYDIDASEDSLTFNTETAWSPMNECIKELINKEAPDADIIYSSVESGCEIYWTNDPDLVCNYYVDDLNGEIEFSATADYVWELFQKKFPGSDETDLDEIISKLDEVEVIVHKWEDVEV